MAASLNHSVASFHVFNQESESNVLNTKILKPLDEVLRCHICFDYFTNCMITKCSHNYCSVCIRRYMAYKSQCPTCFQVATEPELQNNRLIDEVLRIYKKIREALQIPFDTVENFSADLPSSSKVFKDEPKELSKMDTSSDVISRRQKIQSASEISSSDEVSCPVCYTLVSSDRINIHLDSCLKQPEERNGRKTLPKLVYHLLSDKQIRKKLKDHGLSTSGDRQALIRRHKNFIILYNANCDALNPKPVSDLLLEIERQELEERVNASQKNTSVNKKSEPSAIERENETYAKEHQSQFNALVMDVQQRELRKTAIKNEDDSSLESTTNNIVDEFGNKIGESSFQVGNISETVTVKQEISESPPQSPCSDNIMESDDSGSRDSVSSKKSDKDKQLGTLYLPFRIKKEVSIRMKDDSPSLLDMQNSDEELFADSPSSIDDFEINKMKPRSCHKKNIRKLSIGDRKGSPRKK